MRRGHKKIRSEIGSIVLEASIAMSLFLVFICAAISSITSVNAELYMQRASENVVSELNVAIPFASNGIQCVDDVVSVFGIADKASIDTDKLDETLGMFGTAAGLTGVDIEDVIGTALFGRYVRDRIVEEYRSLINKDWIYDNLVQNVSVYLDYEGADKCVYVCVYYDIEAGRIRIPRSYCTSFSLYADAIPLRTKADDDDDKETDSVWDLDNFERGTAIREHFGGNLPSSFPTISSYSDNEIVSIKSMDTTAPYYQDGGNVKKKMRSYIKDLEEFEGAEYSGTTVTVLPDTRKTLFLVIPENGSEESLRYINEMKSYASEKGVDLKIEKYEKSHHYDNTDTSDS